MVQDEMENKLKKSFKHKQKTGRSSKTFSILNGKKRERVMNG